MINPYTSKCKIRKEKKNRKKWKTKNISGENAKNMVEQLTWQCWRFKRYHLKGNKADKK